MDRHLTLEAVRLTESAAIYASRYMGKGDENEAYESATNAMFKVFSSIAVDGEIVVGSKNPNNKLHDGSIVGNQNGLKVDIAVKPLEGKRTCAWGGHNAISISAIGPKGTFLKTPPMYMNKIAVGPEAKGIIDINQTPEINIKRVARAKGKYIEDMTVCVLDRQVNHKLVENIRKTGARIKYITDGDISGAIATAIGDNTIDIMMGIGGAKEGVISAAALKCLGGDIHGQIVYADKKEKEIATYLGKGDCDKIYTLSDFIMNNDVLVSVTGVTDGVLLKGVHYIQGGAETHSIILRQKTHTQRFITAIHHFDYKPIF
jgi:fructose-1,6-bisphosphatase II